MIDGNISYIPRILDLGSVLKSKSCFLFGPRQTGKTSLINHTLQGCRKYDLLEPDTFLSLSQNPKRLEEEIQTEDKIIIIYEIQRIPSLLNDVHRLIEKYQIHFLLTGSSARKLRRGGVNLLGGRARSRAIFPLTFQELGEHFDLTKALTNGLIPSIYFSDSPIEDLKSYTGDYLKEEIITEGAVRNIPAFSRFLEVAALCSGTIINFTKIANDAQVSRTTVQEYFQILKDTLIAYEIPPWKQKTIRKTISTSKYYLFDIGVTRYLQHQVQLVPKSTEYGHAFETYIAHELKAYTEYNMLEPLAFWQSVSGHEVDFILNNQVAIEVKTSNNVSKQDIKGLYKLKEEGLLKKYIVISMEARPRVLDGIQIMPYLDFLKKLWANELML